MTLRPTEVFTITYQIPAAGDSATYYIRAYIRNAQDDTLLATVDLVNQGSGRFRGEWEVPADPKGEGFYITITKKVFTDSSYLTASPRYSVDEEVYLIQERYNRNFGGGGGADINYKTIRKIIQEEIDKKKLDVNLGPIIKELLTTREKIASIKFPEIDFEPLFKIIGLSNKEIKERINNIKIPENDLTPLTESLNRFLEELNSFKEISEKKTMGAVGNIKIALEKAIIDIEKKVRESIKSIDTKIESAPTFTLFERKPEKKQEVIKRKRKFIL